MEENKIIAEFMGYKYCIGVSLGDSWSRFFKIGGTFEDSFAKAKYHTSWDWLMPVVEKIESLGFNSTIRNTSSEFYQSTPWRNDKINCQNSFGKTKIEGTYNAIITFIKWYNNKL